MFASCSAWCRWAASWARSSVTSRTVFRNERLPSPRSVGTHEITAGKRVPSARASSMSNDPPPAATTSASSLPFFSSDSPGQNGNGARAPISRASEKPVIAHSAGLTWTITPSRVSAKPSDIAARIVADRSPSARRCSTSARTATPTDDRDDEHQRAAAPAGRRVLRAAETSIGTK